MISLKDKKTVITGAASGIGRAAALLFADLGADVAIVDINEAGAQEVAREVEARGRRGLAVKTDITDFEQVKAMAKTVHQAFGRLDVLVNNAGWDKLEPFLQNTPETWQKVIGINLWGNIHCTRAVLEYMVQQEGAPGCIVNVASDAGRGGSFGEGVYSACKGGVIAFTKTLAREVSRQNIRVNVVCPGLTETALLSEIRQEGEKVVDAIVKSTPLRRTGKPEEVAAAIAFLASDAASFITGQTLSVSGGLTMM